MCSTQFSSAILIIIALGSFSPFVDSAVLVYLPSGTNLTLQSFPQRYGENTRDFAPVTGRFGGIPRASSDSGALTPKGMILALQYRGWTAPFVEEILSDWKVRFDPIAVIYYHTSDSAFWGDGFPGSQLLPLFLTSLPHSKDLRICQHWCLCQRRRLPSGRYERAGVDQFR